MFCISNKTFVRSSRGSYSPAAVSEHWTYRTHCHLCPTRYSFSPESSEAFEGEVSCRRTHYLNNVPSLRGEKHDISLKILHQAGFETARQAATFAERHALAIAPCPSIYIFDQFRQHTLLSAHIFNNLFSIFVGINFFYISSSPPPPPLPTRYIMLRLKQPYSMVIIVLRDPSNFHPLEVVSRYRDPQLQVGENYSYVFNLRPNIFPNRDV